MRAALCDGGVVRARFLVGDAAHRMTPMGGTGMNTAVHAGHNLGWRLARAARGMGGDALLDGYEAESRRTCCARGAAAGRWAAPAAWNTTSTTYGLGDEGAVLVRPDGHCKPALPALDVGHFAALADAVLGMARRVDTNRSPMRRKPVTAPDPDLVDQLMALWLNPPSDDDAGVAAFRALYTDPVDVNGTVFTAAGLLARVRALHRAYSGLRHEILDVVTAPGRLVVAFRMCGAHTGPLVTALGTVAPTGADVAIRTIDVLRLVDGRIAAVDVVGDELGLLTGLGVLELRSPGMDRGMDRSRRP